MRRAGHSSRLRAAGAAHRRADRRAPSGPRGGRGARPSGSARRAGGCSPARRRGPRSRARSISGRSWLRATRCVDPVGLVEGLRAEAVRRGVRVFERAPAEGFDFGRDRVVVRSGSGRVRARAGGPRDQRLLAPALPGARAPVPAALRLHPRQRAALRGRARRHRLEARAGRRGRADLLQLLPADLRRPDPLGHERGRLLSGQPRGRLAATIRRRTTRLSRRASAGTSRSSRTSSSRTPGAGRSPRPRG